MVETTATAPTTSSSSGSESGPDTGSDTAGEPCGNGKLEADEACDDGNLVNGDGCNTDCLVSAAMLWEYRSGNSGDDDFKGVAVTADAKIFVAGARFVDGGSQDRWVAHFQDETMVWAETYDRGDFEALLAVGIHDSAVYVAGATMPAGEYAVWVARLDSSGKITWEDEVDSGFGKGFVSNLSVTPEGDVVVAGVVSIEGGLASTWTRRYGASGEVQWTHAVPMDSKALFTVGPGVTVTAEQVVVGAYRSPQPDTFQAILLAYPLGGGEPSWMVDLPTKGAVFGAASDPSGDATLVLQDASLKFVVNRTSSSGEVLWSSTDCSGDIGKAVAVDSQGDLVVIGGGQGMFGRNIRLCKFTAEGKLRWGKDLDGGSGDDIGLAVAVLPDDRIVAAGSMWGGDDVRTDAWLAVFTP